MPVITGELKSKVDRIWDAFWSGGISNPLEVIEQITYLLFLRRLDEMHTLSEKKANLGGGVIEDARFLPGQEHLRWSRFKNLDADVMYKTVATEVFPFVQQYGAQVGGDDSTLTDHMKDARFTIPTSALLSKVVDMLDDIPMDKRDTNGDLYEYMLGKIASAGQNGQFRTPRHIIKLMVDMTAPKPDDEICDPACGTAGFLVAASEHIRDKHPSALTDATQRRHFHRSMFHGYDFDNVMLRIGSMNMLLHGIESPDIRYRDSLSEGASDDAEKYTLILANPPFAGSLDAEAVSKTLQRTVKTRKTELLFLALFLQLLETGGRAAVIVPDGVLFGSSKAHRELRRMLVEEQKLDAVVKLPSGVFKPYAGVSTAILFFTRTDSGGTDDVWFYDVRADGFSLDDKRNAIEADDLPDVLSRWQDLAPEQDRARTEQSFLVPKADIVAEGYDLSLNCYREIEHDEVGTSAALGDHRGPRGAGEGDWRWPGGAEDDAVVRTVPLGELVDFHSGGTPSKARGEFWGGEVPWFSAKDLKSPRLRDSTDHVTEAALSSTSLRKLPAGTIAMVVRGMILAHTVPISVLEVEGTINQDLKALLPKCDVDVSYLAAMLRAQHATILSDVSTAAHGTKKLDSRVLEQIPIPFPPLDEQRRIAAILDHADAIRAKRSLALTVVDSLVPSIYTHMFDDKVGLPVALGEIADVKGGKRLPKGAPYAEGPTPHPYIRVTDLRDGVIRTTELSYLTPATQKLIARYTVDRDDVIISIAGSIGMTAVVPPEMAGANLTENAAKITPKSSGQYEGGWLAQALQTHDLQAQIAGKTGQVTIGKLALFRIEQLELRLPPIDQQRRFLRRIAGVHLQKVIQARLFAAHDELFASLESRAFRGDL